MKFQATPFPQIPERDASGKWRLQNWSVAPDADALQALAAGIWNAAEQTAQRPLVILSTAGPLMGIREALERYRPHGIASHIAFLPQVMSFVDWMGSAPQSWAFAKTQTPPERWLAVYAALQKHPKLKAWFKAETEAGAWGLAQAIIAACDTLSNSLLPQFGFNVEHYHSESWIEHVQSLLEAAIEAAYPQLARKVVDHEAEVLLLFWRYLSGPSDPVFRKHLALSAHLRAAMQSDQARPLIWVQTADPMPSDQVLLQDFLGAYAAYAPVIEIGLDWTRVGLWQEALVEGESSPLELKQRCFKNSQAAYRGQWRLLSANRFEELAWMAAKCLEERLIAGKTSIALVAQDRLVARRARALLARLGPALHIRDETGWKLSTTRAAAALHSWLELIRSPKDGPSANALLEFLQNPFLDLARLLGVPAQDCLGLVAELEDRLIASHAQSGWETFHLALEGIQYGSNYRQAPANPLVLQLVQSIRGRLNQWRGNTVQLSVAYAQLQGDLEAFGMTALFEQDAAGKQLLETLNKLDVLTESNRGAQSKPTALRTSEWLSLLKTIIEEAAYQEDSQAAEATLRILPLSATRLRQFDAVIVVGADERHLPAFSEPPLFFSEALSRLLHASTISAEYRQQARDVSQLLVTCPEVDLLWQSKSISGEPIRPSAWIARLQLALPQWQVSNSASVLGQAVRGGQAKAMLMASATPSAHLPLPLSMSPSAYHTLRDCPYRYYVRSLLGLRQHQGLDEDFDASIAGQTIHAILYQFFHALKTEEQKNPEIIPFASDARQLWMEQHLDRISEQVFGRLIEGDARVLGILRDWQKQIPSFVQWQLQREELGWRYHDGETKVGFDLPFSSADGEERYMRVEGYADRFDVLATDTRSAAVLDYKYQSAQKVRARADHVLDDPQLLIYAMAANQPEAALGSQGRQTNEAEWVALKLDRKERSTAATRSISVANLEQRLPEFTEQIRSDVELLWSRKTLHAFAPDTVCMYCEARGVCRKGMW